MNRAEAAVIARSKKRIVPMPDRFWQKVDVRGVDDCWPWKAARRNKQGYGAFWLDGRHQPASRVAAQLTGVMLLKGQHVLHRCDNPPCCNPHHLFAGTSLENNADKVAKGRHVHGETHSRAILSAEAVATIRAAKPAGVKRVANGANQKLAIEFGVSPEYVSEVRGRGWGKPR